ncbi:MAG: hypothetical protein QNJ29_12675 [Rhizobiaceae bacterium]|nr:hypothetical protein [Rhizobiaceae bacterium]
MTDTIMTTIAKGLDITEIACGKGFSHKRVIDTRCDGARARPIEEAVLKRLKNHFIDYAQVPMDFSDVGPCQEVHLCEMVTESEVDTLVVTDDLTQLSALLNIYKVEFKSNSFYVVETGKGELIKPVFEADEQIKQAPTARFGTFGS